MSTGLRNDDDAGRALLDHQEATVLLNNNRNCQISLKHGDGGVLNTELTEFYFDFTGLPDLVKHLSVELGN
jgi:hypothetical protein